MLFNLNGTEWMNSWEIHTDDGEETTYPNLKKKSSTWSSSPRGTTEHVGGGGTPVHFFVILGGETSLPLSFNKKKVCTFFIQCIIIARKLFKAKSTVQCIEKSYTKTLLEDRFDAKHGFCIFSSHLFLCFMIFKFFALSMLTLSQKHGNLW